MKSSKRNTREKQLKATRKAAAVRTLSESLLKPIKGGVGPAIIIVRPPLISSDPIC